MGYDDWDVAGFGDFEPDDFEVFNQNEADDYRNEHEDGEVYDDDHEDDYPFYGGEDSHLEAAYEDRFTSWELAMGFDN